MSLYNNPVAAVRQMHANRSRASSRAYFGVVRKRIKVRAIAATIAEPKRAPQAPFIVFSHKDDSSRMISKLGITYFESILAYLYSIASYFRGERCQLLGKRMQSLCFTGASKGEMNGVESTLYAASEQGEG